jgi:hypothetical protein
MKIALLAIVGLFLGGIVGGAAGVALGLIYTTVAHTTSFEGYSGMLVFFTFMPIGIIVGALVGAAGLGFIGGRDDSARRPTGAP